MSWARPAPLKFSAPVTLIWSMFVPAVVPVMFEKSRVAKAVRFNAPPTVNWPEAVLLPGDIQ